MLAIAPPVNHTDALIGQSCMRQLLSGHCWFDSWACRSGVDSWFWRERWPWNWYTPASIIATLLSSILTSTGSGAVPMSSNTIGTREHTQLVVTCKWLLCYLRRQMYGATRHPFVSNRHCMLYTLHIRSIWSISWSRLVYTYVKRLAVRSFRACSLDCIELSNIPKSCVHSLQISWQLRVLVPYFMCILS